MNSFLVRLRANKNGIEDLTNNIWNTTPTYFFDAELDRYVLSLNNNIMKSTIEDIGNSDFTITFWYKAKNLDKIGWNVIFGFANDLKGIAINGNGQLYILWGSGSNQYEATGITVELNKWAYITITHKGNQTYLFKNGNLMYTTNTCFVPDTDIYIGGITISSYWYCIADIDDFCILKGTTLWTDDFTLPTSYLSSEKRAYVNLKDNSIWCIC